jgi:predicted unusual protein kinase regulating ubiquinone biosynthesis (AarF/ABC1/UbiB family)
LADELPKGRLARGLALMKLAARELPLVGERVLAPSGFRERDLSRLKESAEQAAKVLGDLRGLALKLGQTASYVDGLLPPHATEAYQKALARLQSSAPTVPFEQVQAEIERGLGRPLTEAFAHFERTPLAAASIGQVHRATLHDPHGEAHEVAVKVQYPGIAQALTSDLRNLEVLRPVLALLAPGADTGGGMDEVVSRLAEELDYTHEASNQERFRALVAGYPDVLVPAVHRSHLARNVLVTEFVRGRTVRQVALEGEQALRDRVGAAIFRFTLGTAFTRGVFNTDPHPGNYVVRDDGQVAFLDFGSVKYLQPELHRRWRRLATHLVNGRLDAWRRESAELLGMEHMDPRARELNQQYLLYTAAVVARDEEITIDKHLLRDAVDEGIANAKKIIREVGVMPSRAKTMKLPPDFVMIGRMQIGLFAVLAQLRPRANWNRILREMLAATESP